MKKFKKMVMPFAMVGMLLLGSSSIYANSKIKNEGIEVDSANYFQQNFDKNLLDKNYNTIIIDKNGQITYDYDSSIPETEATPDNPKARASINVTDSDVWRIINDVGHGPEYYAYGYVTAKEYHYARAEMWYQGSQYVGGKNYWGTGQVYAISDWCFGPNAVPRIFYGN